MRPTLKLAVIGVLALPAFAGNIDVSFAHPESECLSYKSSPKKISESGDAAVLSVDSEPRGAEVYVDFEYQGETPLTNARVPAGNIPVTLVKEGFERKTVRVSLKAGETKSLGVVPLGSAFGEISIRSHPARATVILDGEKINARTPVVIRRIPREKPHTIRLQLEGFETWERVITLDDKDKKKFHIELERTPSP